jgi:hypothetical protein
MEMLEIFIYNEIFVSIYEEIKRKNEDRRLSIQYKSKTSTPRWAIIRAAF